MKQQTKPEKMIYSGNIGLWYYQRLLNKVIQHKDKHPGENSKAFLTWLKKQTDEVLEKKWTEELKQKLISDTYSQKAYIEPETVPQGSLTKSVKELFYAFPLTTTYPGLVSGVGYEHEIGFPNEFKLGFVFDHTSGMPYIPGSSVKGKIRSVFRDIDYLNSVITDLKDKNEIENTFPELNRKQWAKLERHIFEGIDYQSGIKLVYKADAFLDAFITGVVEKSQNQKRFLADDFITSHQNNEHPELSPFTEPNPVRFLKIRSDVKITFQFRLYATPIEDDFIFNADMKKNLFKAILKDFGIGAKTRVGYGQLE